MKNTTYIEKVDPTICYMNYEKSEFKKKYIIDDIERRPNDEGTPALYVTLKTNNPQMYYIVAEITDFTMLVNPMEHEDQNDLLKVIFDRQPFTKEFNKAYNEAKTLEYNNEYWSKVESIPMDEDYQNKLDVLTDTYENALKSIVQFDEPTYSSISEK